MSASPDIVICGAGIAGVTTAYQLAGLTSAVDTDQ